MFSTEDAMQASVHSNPQLILSGIPEINPVFCPDSPGLISLGREIQLASGPIDNLFIDANAVLTFVECKRYCDSRLKREVYPQALNYASDLQSQLIHFTGDEFPREFMGILASAQQAPFENINQLMEALEQDQLITERNIDTREWRRQFRERLEYNVKAGICRVVILCAPAPNSTFNYRSVRNLIQLMTFSEQSTARYDLLLMDLREEMDTLLSRIIWRRYAALPQIPLVARSSRDTSASIGRMKQREDELPQTDKAVLDGFLRALEEHGLMAVENTFGYAIKSEKTKRSIYTQITMKDGAWTIVRNQIRPPEPLYCRLDANEALPEVDGLEARIIEKRSSIGSGKLFDIEIQPRPTDPTERLIRAVLDLAIRD